jgi:hypothetical protein
VLSALKYSADAHSSSADLTHLNLPHPKLALLFESEWPVRCVDLGAGAS